MANSKLLIDFWIFGPEFGCLAREIAVIRRFSPGDFRFRVFVHKKLVRRASLSLKALPCEIIPYRFGLTLKYRTDYDIAIYRTLGNLSRYRENHGLWPWLNHF